MLCIGEPILLIQKFSILSMPVHSITKVGGKDRITHFHLLLCEVIVMTRLRSPCRECDMAG